MYYQYTTEKERKQKDLNRCSFLKNRDLYFFLPKPFRLLGKHERWRKEADTLNLSKPAKQRLEWFVFYETKAEFNASQTARHFGISTKTFYKWKNIFDGKNLRLLEDGDKAPKHTRQKEITPEEETRIIDLRKKHIRWGKLKLKKIYEGQYLQEISSWKIQYTIKKHKLYYHPIKNEKLQKKRKRNQKKKRITELSKKQYPGFLICFDTIVIYWNGVKRYIFTGIDSISKVAFARMYTTKSSYNARDFLLRMHYLLEGKMLNAGHDNGSEFHKLFAQLCAELNIPQYFSRPHTPKDNPVCEKFNQTLQQEFIDLGNFTPDCTEFNRLLTEWLIEYNFVRPHQTLGYSTPIQFTEKTLKVLPMWPSRANS